MRNKIFGLSALMGALLATPTWAVEWDLAVNYTALHTTNTARTTDNEIDEWIHQPGISVGAEHDGPNLQLSGGYQFERRIYEEDLFDDDSVTTGSAELLWHVVPERFDFVVRNSRTESARRSIEAITQDNRQVVSTTEAGPTLRFRTRGNDEFQLSYLYTDVNAETQTSSKRHTGTARYIVAFSATRSLTFEASSSQVEFDNSAAPDLDIWIGSATLAQTGSNTELSLTGGYTSVSRSSGLDDVDGPIFDLDLTWQASPNTVLGISGSRRIDDRSSALRAGTSDFGDSVDANSDLNEVFTETMAEISLTRTFGRSRLGIRVFALQEDYEDVLRDNDRTGVGLTFGRDLTPLTTLSARIEVGTREFDDENEELDEVRGNVQLVWRAGRRLTVSIGVAYEEREADTLGTRDYDEWLARFGVSYALLGSRR